MGSTRVPWAPLMMHLGELLPAPYTLLARDIVPSILPPQRRVMHRTYALIRLPRITAREHLTNVAPPA